MENEEIVGLLREFKQENSEQHKEIMGVFDKSDKDQQEQIDDHCLRLRSVEKQIAINEAEFAPIKKLYDNLTSAMIGFFILIGSLVIGLAYYLKNKIE